MWALIKSPPQLNLAIRHLHLKRIMYKNQEKGVQKIVFNCSRNLVGYVFAIRESNVLWPEPAFQRHWYRVCGCG